MTGIVYDAKHAAIPGTLMVVNIGKTEAKVETVAHSFLQLCRANPDDSDVRVSQISAPTRVLVELRGCAFRAAAAAPEGQRRVVHRLLLLLVFKGVWHYDGKWLMLLLGA